MIHAHHFIFANFNSEGIRLIQTPDADKLLKKQSLQTLYELSKIQSNNIFVNKFPTEQIVAFTSITTTHDEYGRQTTWNHTILIPYDDIFNECMSRVKEQFIQPQDKPPKKMEMLQIG